MLKKNEIALDMLVKIQISNNEVHLILIKCTVKNETKGLFCIYPTWGGSSLSKDK